MAVENNNIDMDQSQVPQKRENNEAVSKKEVKKSREALEVGGTVLWQSFYLSD